MSKNYEKVKSYYDLGLWSIERVQRAVVKGWITEEEFEEITKEVYVPTAEQQLKAKKQKDYYMCTKI